jgi:hypothetical protein
LLKNIVVSTLEFMENRANICVTSLPEACDLLEEAGNWNPSDRQFPYGLCQVDQPAGHFASAF